MILPPAETMPVRQPDNRLGSSVLGSRWKGTMAAVPIWFSMSIRIEIAPPWARRWLVTTRDRSGVGQKPRLCAGAETSDRSTRAPKRSDLPHGGRWCRPRRNERITQMPRGMKDSRGRTVGAAFQTGGDQYPCGSMGDGGPRAGLRSNGSDSVQCVRWFRYRMSSIRWLRIGTVGMKEVSCSRNRRAAVQFVSIDCRTLTVYPETTV